MRKIILTSLLTIVLGVAFSQNCVTDTTITESGIYPETLDTAKLDEPYAHTFQVLAIKDTVVNYLGNIILAEIDSIKVVEIKGLPASFSYNCEPTNCIFTWEKVGCVKLSGNPTTTEAGIHPLEIITTAYARWGLLRLPVNDTITDYTLLVGEGSASIYTPSKEKVAIYPNPTTDGKFHISSNITIDNVEIVDLQGKHIVFKMEKSDGLALIDISEAETGIYFLRFNAGNRLVNKRIIR
ncbi:MAG: hypothetical protein RLZZ337_732 [Bacteroidota bacterium]|jgi:hypothetical protein